jgi:hypothetical protein
VTLVWLCSGCKSQDKRSKSHKYDSKGNRFKKKPKEGSMLRRPRGSNQHATRGGHSDEEEDEGVPASYHTVSLQVSQDVSMAPFIFSLVPETQNLGGTRESQNSEEISIVFCPSPQPPPTSTGFPHLKPALSLCLSCVYLVTGSHYVALDHLELPV